MNYKKYDTGGNVEEEKEYSPAKSWAMARARLGIAGQSELDKLKAKRSAWKSWLDRMKAEQTSDFVTRNLEQSLWGKLGGGLGLLAGSYLGSKTESDKWDPLISGVTTGLGSAAGRYGAAEWGTQPEDYTYEDFIKANPEYTDDLGGRFHLAEKTDLTNLTEEDIIALETAADQARDEELLEGALASITDAYTGKELSTEDWIKSLFA
tara:strand:+ start:215 stop:838 length:624 start_codon:yes stop_codon:yes gene_type:complete